MTHGDDKDVPLLQNPLSWQCSGSISTLRYHLIKNVGGEFVCVCLNVSVSMCMCECVCVHVHIYMYIPWPGCEVCVCVCLPWPGCGE